MPEQILIQKSDGAREPFAPQKLIASLEHAGASPSLSHSILSHIEKELSPGMTTASIYRHAFSLLKKQAIVPAIKYSLPKAILDFGPSGYPFEDFVAEVLRAKGLSASTRVILKGKCVEHEVDVLIEENGSHSVVEAKFHNMRGIKSDVKVALYVAARVEDLKRGPSGPIRTGWLITNTKFTEQAIRYGVCAGLSLVGWDYPAKGNLHDLISEAGVFPLTALTALSAKEKQELLARDIVLCHNLVKHEKTLREIGVSTKRIGAVFSEIGLLCGHPGGVK